jgi:hypothetical protein
VSFSLNTSTNEKHKAKNFVTKSSGKLTILKTERNWKDENEIILERNNLED